MTWNITTMTQLLESHWVVEQEGDCLSVDNGEGLDAFIYAGQSQIRIETILFPMSIVADSTTLNNVILQTHHLVPLTTICLKQVGGDLYYVAYCALSIDSKESVLLEEINTLFDNVSEFLDMYSHYLDIEES